MSFRADWVDNRINDVNQLPNCVAFIRATPAVLILDDASAVDEWHRHCPVHKIIVCDVVMENSILVVFLAGRNSMA